MFLWQCEIFIKFIKSKALGEYHIDVNKLAEWLSARYTCNSSPVAAIQYYLNVLANQGLLHREYSHSFIVVSHVPTIEAQAPVSDVPEIPAKPDIPAWSEPHYSGRTWEVPYGGPASYDGRFPASYSRVGATVQPLRNGREGSSSAPANVPLRPIGPDTVSQLHAATQVPVGYIQHLLSTRPPENGRREEAVRWAKVTGVAAERWLTLL